jgi:putative ABC transport system ATP-binding protein
MATTMDRPPVSDGQDGFFASNGVPIRVEDLCMVYQTRSGGVAAVDHVTLDIGAGAAIALMGPSGCGKTTFLNLLSGVDRPTDGKILFGGGELTSLSERDLEQHRLLRVGFIFQLFNLIPSLTALENLELPMMLASVPREARLERGRRLLDMVGLADKGDKRPDELSGGEQQRVAAALALVNDPSVILADEPTGSLDSRNTELLAQLLVSLARDYGKTVIMSSHDPKAVDPFPKVLYMRDGRIIDDGER